MILSSEQHKTFYVAKDNKDLIRIFYFILHKLILYLENIVFKATVYLTAYPYNTNKYYSLL